MILVDANLFMYAAGAEHPLKQPSAKFLAVVAGGEVEATIDTETLQEILRRYRSLRRWREGREVYAAARTLFPVATEITVEVLDRACELLNEYTQLMARDAVHAAVVECKAMDGICSFDRDFDLIRGMRRFEPQELLK